jgi:hypothetical protein
MKVKIDSPIGRRQLFIKEWQTARLYRTGFPLNKIIIVTYMDAPLKSRRANV